MSQVDIIVTNFIEVFKHCSEFFLRICHDIIFQSKVRDVLVFYIDVEFFSFQELESVFAIMNSFRGITSPCLTILVKELSSCSVSVLGPTWWLFCTNTLSSSPRPLFWISDCPVPVQHEQHMTSQYNLFISSSGTVILSFNLNLREL